MIVELIGGPRDGETFACDPSIERFDLVGRATMNVAGLWVWVPGAGEKSEVRGRYVRSSVWVDPVFSEASVPCPFYWEPVP